MTINFTKMNGAGNDFVVIDNRDLRYQLDKEEIARLCDRHRGVGADGLLAVEPAENGADYKFRYYNADGGEAEMCGNGARCFARFCASLEEKTPDSLSFETVVGILSAEIIGDQVRIAMGALFDLELNAPVKIPDFSAPVHHLNTGVPHAVAFVDELENLDIAKHGGALRRHLHFAPKGANANFVEILAPDHLRVRTFERGVENETLACGTGITACALIHHLLHDAESPVKIEVAGGDTLEIGFESTGDGNFKNVTLLGPADFVFHGTLEL